MNLGNRNFCLRSSLCQRQFLVGFKLNQFRFQGSAFFAFSLSSLNCSDWT